MQRIHQQQVDFFKSYSYIIPTHLSPKNYDHNIISLDNKDSSIPDIHETHQTSNNDDLSLSFTKKISVDTKIIIHDIPPKIRPQDSMDERKACNSDKTLLSSTDASPCLIQNMPGNFTNNCFIMTPIMIKNDKSYKVKNEKNFIIHHDDNISDEEAKHKERKNIQEIKTPDFLINFLCDHKSSPKPEKKNEKMDSMQEIEYSKDEIRNIIYCKSSKDFLNIKESLSVAGEVNSNECFLTENKDKKVESSSKLKKKDFNLVVNTTNKEEDNYKNEKTQQNLKQKERNAEELENIYKNIEVY